MDFVKVRTFDFSFQANITLTRLQDAGIDCYLKDENTVIMDPILTNAIGGIKLVVREDQEEEAKKLLQLFDEEYMQSVKCPKCGESKITSISRPGAKNFFTAIATWLFSSYAIAPESVYHCGNCGHEMKDLPSSVNEDDLHE
ncbi:MAG TPA: DUF2007 domain-containing protein [Ferruginibacter sp.]|nr:DUF2007 domain-containing protein [Ferruginibacter sp.]